MLVEQLMVLSSVQLVIANKETIEPLGFGSGCLVKYQDRHFLISVAHVTDSDQGIFLETNIPDNFNRPILKPVGGFCHFDLLQIMGPGDASFLSEILDGGERLDISFAAVSADIVALQRELNFGPFKVEAGGKAILDLEDATVPKKEYKYGFFGNVKQKLKGNVLNIQPTLKHNLSYHKSNKHFHLFLAPEIISKSEDYQGCSGAPILGSDGCIVALASKVHTGTRVIYGFSIQECIKLLKIAIGTNQV